MTALPWRPDFIGHISLSTTLPTCSTQTLAWRFFLVGDAPRIQYVDRGKMSVRLQHGRSAGRSLMSVGTTDFTRRDFLRASAGGGFALGGLLGFGMDLRAAQEQVRTLKIAHAREVPSVCPYCAVGCAQIVSVRDKKIINIEGNPESPINRGTLCPKGAATFQLAVNPLRMTKVWYRAPGATDWDKTKSLDWAM